MYYRMEEKKGSYFISGEIFHIHDKNVVDNGSG